MEDGRSPCLLLPKYKRRKVSAIRDFPKGLKHLPDVVDLKSRKGQSCGSQDDLKATGLDDMLSCRIVDSEEKGVHQLRSKRKCDFAVVEVIRDYPKGFKRFPQDVDPKSKRDESCGSKNMKELKRYSEKVVSNAKGDEACRSKNAEELKGSCKELDLNVKGDIACGSKNESLKPIEFHETSIEHEREVGSKERVNQFGTEQQCGIGDKNKVSGFEKKPLHQNFGDFSSSVVIDGVKSWREESTPDSEQDVNHCSEQQRAFYSGNVLTSKESPKCQDIGSSLNACNQTGVTGNRHRTLPKRRRVSAVRDFPPALVRIVFNSLPLVGKGASNDHLGMVECTSSNGATMIEPKYGINDVEVDGQSRIPDEPCMNMENQEFYHPSGRSLAAVNDVQESACQLDGPDNMVYLAPADIASFFSDDCCNGFLFEDDVEPSKTDGQSWQDGSMD
ncbi:hypothetical protein LIER_11362 [Lithospermum erythrorhizon]|uniref:Uncharacterized protein n=1 Tax=Lithospermum erythrorhizon TaxID=34254 RepID=A0AAV3PP74_LITER